MSSKTTQWGDLKDLKLEGKEIFFGVPFDSKNENGIFLGVSKGKKVIENSKANILLVAPAGSGKKVSVEIPTLLSWKESVLVYDFGNELYPLTSGQRKNIFNNMILKLSPFEKNSLGFNPFEEVRFFTEHTEKDLDIIAQAIFSGIKEEKLKENVTILFKLYSISEMFELNSNKMLSKNYITFLHLYNSAKNPQKVFKNIFTEENSAFEYFELYKKLSIKEKEKTFVELKKKLKIFTDTNLSNNTLKSDFNIADLYNYKKPVTLYYTGHPNYVGKDILFKIIISQLIQQKTGNIPDYNYKSEHELFLMLNDFHKIDKIPEIEKKYWKFSNIWNKTFSFN